MHITDFIPTLSPVYPSRKNNDSNDDDDDYENTNPCDSAPVIPSRKTRRMKNAMKDDLAFKSMDKPVKPPTVWTTPQKGIIPKETPKCQPPTIGLDFSSRAVNAAFSNTEVPAYNRFLDLEVMSKGNTQRSRKSKLVVFMGLMALIFSLLIIGIGLLFVRYVAVTAKMVDLEQTATDLQRNSMEEQGDLKTKVADLSNKIVKLEDHLTANMENINKTLENICTRCPVGWNIIGSSCYYVSEEQVTWDKARQECYKMNSFLVMVKDKTESETIKKLFTASRRYWIGLRRDPGEIHIWKWLDGTELTFTNWGVNEPNYYATREHCGETISGPWNDRSCLDPLFYICKRIRTC
ncbi:C-type lectin domain family 4 member G-like [Eleutherodactylus coqui]|uniref:C-type lectin domain family 4 member G-like n=1 Tax=Eleutherodactylus coqui TaxID=57060 RepID=UPI003461FE7F